MSTPEIKLLRDGRLTWPVTDGKRGDATNHKTINAAKRHVRSLKLPLGACRRVDSLQRNGEQVPA